MARLYALLVGINDYPPGIDKLQGCLNDVDNVHDYLKSHVDDPAIVVLKDADATRANFIAQFRGHLGRAGKDDVAMLHYCGHGARSTAAPEFREFDLVGKDQGIVLIDSRLSDATWDLADKELAVLLAELSRNDPHIAMIFDCCNSGSGTRKLEGPGGQGVRTTKGVPTPRPLETYLDGYYDSLHKSGDSMAPPPSRHILLAACDRTQTAKEDLDTHQGIFTTRLFDVLRGSPGPMTYADLFVRSRAAVRRYIADNDKSPQDPQFETVGDFDAYAGVLGRAGAETRRTYSVFHDAGRWQVDCGAIQGMPVDPAVPVTLALFPEADGGEKAGLARTFRVGAQTSEINLEFAADLSARFKAEIITLPAAPLLVAFEGDDATRTALQAALDADGAAHVQLTDRGADDGYVLVRAGDQLQLRLRDQDEAIRSIALAGEEAKWTAAAVRLLAHVAQWERSLALANPRPQLDPALVDFVFAEQIDGGEHVHQGPELTLEYREIDGRWRDVLGKLRLRNRTGQLLHFTLLHLSADYGIRVMAQDQIPPNADEWMTLVVGTAKPSPDVYFSVDGAANQTVERLKLIVSTERVDDFLLALDPLGDDRGFGSAAEAPEAAKPIENDWFVKDMRVTVARRLDQVGPAEAVLAGGKVTVAAHPTVTASLSLSAAKGAAREVGSGTDFRHALELRGMRLLDLAGTRGDGENVLELTDITNAGALAAEPLQIRLDVPLADGETIMPVVHDGQHILLAGDTWRDEAGATHVAIDHLPEVAVDRRSLGGALKLYFFKTYFGMTDVNRLRWVEFPDAGGFVQHDSGVAAKVAGAANILLVAHGIIGDTQAILPGLQASGIATRFDLVLSYDYENLATPIEQTAARLGEALAAAGLHAEDGRKLTMLVHSMGGLVARWLIEQGGGARLVDHLVLCGTPSRGSPFGRVDTARKLLGMLASVSVNYVPALAAPALFLLNRSKKVTATLEQMNPASPFITALNASPDPGVRYTILAGDVDRYQEPADQHFEALLAKTGRGTLFDLLFANQANDIAVGVESILGVADRGASPPDRHNVACHHLNYFGSAAGLAALQAIDWDDAPALAVTAVSGPAGPVAT